MGKPRDSMIRFRAMASLIAAAACGSIVAVEPPAPQAIFDEAVRLFFEAKPVESAREFDRLVEAVPRAEPELWQRGLALYYAGRFEDGRLQFERHKTVNPDDVENPAWHFLCVARLEGPEAARKAMLPVGEDRRVPMREILDLYAGRGDAAAVLAAAERGEEEARRNQLCYAHLYLGLHAEATGDVEKARHHVTLAAGPFRMDHYMGRVAVVHAKLRGWDVALDDDLQPDTRNRK
jgi:lipoprotein NlpI